MELTTRQKLFLLKFLEYFRKSQEPVHYESLAKELGLSKSTTYEMLKLLESNDYVRAVYVMPPEPRKIGRSKVMFLPSEKNLEQLFRPLGGEDATDNQLREFLIRAVEKATATQDGFWKDWSSEMRNVLAIAAKEDKSLAPVSETGGRTEEWEDIKTAIQTVVKRRKKSNPEEVVFEMAALIRTTKSPLAFCAEVLTSILLIISKADFVYDYQSPIKMLLGNQVSKDSMIMFLGLSWGLGLSNRKMRMLLGDFQRDIAAYMEMIDQVSQEELVELHEFILDIWKLISEAS